jgi:hypothetical protein
MPYFTGNMLHSSTPTAKLSVSYIRTPVKSVVRKFISKTARAVRTNTMHLLITNLMSNDLGFRYVVDARMRTIEGDG